jgi:hypothetical protein
LPTTILSPAADLSFIDDAKTKFRAESAYLDDGPSAPLRFNAEANLTQVIGREEKNIDPGEARAQLVDRTKAIFGGPFTKNELCWNLGDELIRRRSI